MLTDLINGAITQQVVDCGNQKGRAILGIAKKVITRFTKKIANFACGVIVVNVKRILFADGSANGALPVLIDEHLVESFQAQAIIKSEGSSFLVSKRVSQILSLDRDHIINRTYRIFSLPWASLCVLIAECKMLPHFSAIVGFSAKLARLQNPTTRFTEFQVMPGVWIKEFLGVSPRLKLGMVTFFTMIGDPQRKGFVGSKFRSVLNGLTYCASMLSIGQANAYAVLSPVGNKLASLDDASTPVTCSNIGTFHSSNFGTLASTIKRLIAPDIDIDQASASRSIFSRSGFSMRNIMVSVLGNGIFICHNESNTAKAARQAVYFKKEKRLLTIAAIA